MNVELIDVMGDDLRVVNAARVSFDKTSDELTEKDQRLIQYLAKHNHWTPFSHVMITMRETVPIFVSRQRFKHTVGFTYNEVSRRYVDDEPKFYIPEVWRKRAEDKKQGSSDEPIDMLVSKDGVETYSLSEDYPILLDVCLNTYNLMIENGVAPEQARMILPQSMYTSYYVTGSLAAWARAYKLRSSPDAQKEIQLLAQEWDRLIRTQGNLTYSWKALTEN